MIEWGIIWMTGWLPWEWNNFLNCASEVDLLHLFIYLFVYQTIGILLCTLHSADHVNECKVTVILLSVLIFIQILIVALLRAAQLFKM